MLFLKEIISKILLNTSSAEIDKLRQDLTNSQAILRNEAQNLEQKVAEQTFQLSAERNKLSVTLSGITDGVIAIDLNKNIVIFNKAAERLTGYSQEEVNNKPIDQVLKIYDQNNELTFLHYCPIRTDGFEGVIYSKGALRVVGKRQSFVNLITGQIAEGKAVNLGCILTLHDMTGEKQLESMKLDFVSMAAHELRTPLTSIKGYLSVFISENKHKLNSDQMQLLNSLSTATEQLTSLVENLLSVTRIERGVLNISLESIDWTKFIRDSVNVLTPRAKEKQIDLQFLEPTQPVPQLKIDKVRITEVVSNLINNAINYTEPGGSIKVWVEASGNDVVTNIQDTGRGIPKEAIPQLFNKFYRVTGSLEQGTKGTGLGLYITKSILDIHHGKIWVNSEVGKGSTFSFSLPLG